LPIAAPLVACRCCGRHPNASNASNIPNAPIAAFPTAIECHYIPIYINNRYQKAITPNYKSAFIFVQMAKIGELHKAKSMRKKILQP
ncbi:MAG: hypothetical protein IKC42_03105, partial [Alistipes sp.]|nr:hypothetical protein [Alistipes sp.]